MYYVGGEVMQYARDYRPGIGQGWRELRPGTAAPCVLQPGRQRAQSAMQRAESRVCKLLRASGRTTRVQREAEAALAQILVMEQSANGLEPELQRELLVCAATHERQRAQK